MNIIYVKKRRKLGYGFPALDASGDNFQAFTDAVTRYTNDNSSQSNNNTAVRFSDDQNTSPTYWTVDSSYRYARGAVDKNGIVFVAPRSNESCFTIDTSNDAINIFDHPTTSFSNTSYWGSFARFNHSMYSPSDDIMYSFGNYGGKVLKYTHSNFTFDEITLASSFAKISKTIWYDGVIYCFREADSGNRVNTIWTGDTSTDTWTYKSVTNGLEKSNAVDYQLGPGGYVYRFGLNKIEKIQLNGAGNDVTASVLDTYTDTDGLGYYGPVDDLSSCLGPDGHMYIFPSSRSSTGTRDSDYFIMKFDPFNETYEMISMKRSTLSVGDTVPASSGGTVQPQLCPDGKIMVCCYYAREHYTSRGWAGTFSPGIWNPSSEEWEETPSWGTIPAQWGLHQKVGIGKKGNMYLSPARHRLNSTTGYYEAALKFRDDADVAPPKEFFASSIL